MNRSSGTETSPDNTIRRVKLGLRFKLSVMIVCGVVTACLFIGFAVAGKIRSTMQFDMLRFSSAILLEDIASAREYLNLSRNTAMAAELNLDASAIENMRAQQVAALQRNAEFFHSLVNLLTQDRTFDVAFLIDYDRRTLLDNNPPANDTTTYTYFQNRPDLPAGVMWQTFADQQLGPTLAEGLRRTITVDPQLMFTMTGPEQQDDRWKDMPYIMVGLPVFRDASDREFYRDWLDFNSGKVATENRVTRKAEYRREFIRRCVLSGANIDYTLPCQDDAAIQSFVGWFFASWQASPWQAVDYQAVSETLRTSIRERTVDERISVSALREIWAVTAQDNRFTPVEQLSVWQQSIRLWSYFNSLGLYPESQLETEELALRAYRADLRGVLGMFLWKYVYHTRISRELHDLFNLLLSIALRAAILSLFLPVFILRSVDRLAAGAWAIGRGELDTRITIDGSDELGRLADIFNVMTGNLKKARDTMVENKRMEIELNTAQQIQTALLPASFPDITGLCFAARYQSQSESGGDYYDVFALDDHRLALVMADVSGHGVGSGLVMAMTRTLVHTGGRSAASPKKLFESINSYLYENTARSFFVSVFYGVLDTSSMKLSYASAGHPPCLVIRGDTIRELPAGGIALGVVADETAMSMIDVRSVQLQPGDCVVQYTDGIYEAMNAEGREYGMERFKTALSKNSNKPAPEIVENVLSDIKDFTENHTQSDDICILAVQLERS